LEAGSKVKINDEMLTREGNLQAQADAVEDESTVMPLISGDVT